MRIATPDGTRADIHAVARGRRCGKNCRSRDVCAQRPCIPFQQATYRFWANASRARRGRLFQRVQQVRRSPGTAHASIHEPRRSAAARSRRNVMRLCNRKKGERHATEARHIEGNHRAQRQGRKEGGQIAKAICRYRAESGAQVRRKDSEEAQLDIRVDAARWDRSDRAAPVRRSSAPANGRVPRRIPDARRVAATVPCACTRVHRRARTVPSRRKRQAVRRFQRDRRTP